MTLMSDLALSSYAKLNGMSSQRDVPQRMEAYFAKNYESHSFGNATLSNKFCFIIFDIMTTIEFEFMPTLLRYSHEQREDYTPVI